ncbi:hypothetical protein K1719_026238 [Acacia pycnantha]|nr:hypothetical protein K1719_026238 [Acacia pycnantha]
MEIMVKGIRGDVIPRLFAGTFRGAAQLWFHSLPYLSIPDMKTLEQKFLLNFATSRRQPKSEFQLAQIPGLKDEVHLHCIVAGLDVSSRLKKSIIKRRPTTLADFHGRSQQYLELEQMEMAASTVKDRPKSPPHRGRENQEAHKKNLRARDSNDKSRDAKYEKYTPLKVSQAKLWKEVCATEMKKVERPRPLGRSDTADKTRFCEFHHQHGHTIEQCWDLRDAVEKFVRDRKLRKYVIQTQGK